jgi:hypothetical protein
MSDERRRHPRRAVDVPALLLADGASMPVHLHDVCRDAALIESDRPLPLDAHVELRLTLPGVSTPLDVRGRVIRVTAGEQQLHAAAVLFDDLPPKDATRIDFFVALYDADDLGACRTETPALPSARAAGSGVG